MMKLYCLLDDDKGYEGEENSKGSARSGCVVEFNFLSLENKTRLLKRISRKEISFIL